MYGAACLFDVCMPLSCASALQVKQAYVQSLMPEVDEMMSSGKHQFMAAVEFYEAVRNRLRSHIRVCATGLYIIIAIVHKMFFQNMTVIT